MVSPRSNPDRVASIMLSRHALDLVSCTTLQTLWAGYGQICAINARATTDKAAEHLDRLCGLELGSAGTIYPLVLKLISPPSKSRNADEGHLRKMLSYEVEQYFYSDVVPQLGDVAVAKCLASTRGIESEELGGLMATIMVDLRPKFPVCGGKRSALDRAQVHGALDWLADFHGRSRGASSLDSLGEYVLPPLEEYGKRQKSGKDTSSSGLWLNGGYTYLATRRTEYASLVEDTDSEWSEALCGAFSQESSLSVAEVAALFLTPCGRSFESYIHGDVKSENLFTTTDGDVAFFDFQYIGLGLGVCDLAKLFTCSVPLQMLLDDTDADELPEQLRMHDAEKRLLEWYRTRLLQGEGDAYEWETFQRHWETALVDWCRFQASWGFWGNTEWLEARVRSILSDQAWRDWLQHNTSNRSMHRA